MTDDKMNDLIKLAKNEYHRNWQRNNKDRVKKAQEKYWQKKALKLQKGDA